MRDKLISFMKNRNWHNKIAKTIPRTQSLFEHSLMVYDVVDSMIELLDSGKPLSDKEKNILRIAAILHDIGKEKEEWQEAIRTGKKIPSHIDENLSKIAISDLSKIIKFEDSQAILNCICLHMKATQTTGNILKAKILEPEVSNWKELQDFIDSADNLASCGSVLEAVELLENPQRFKVGKLFKYSYHHIYLRGVSSVFLHKACQSCYQEKGWQPVLYFPEGTIYLFTKQNAIPEIEEIKDSLVKLFDEGNYFGKHISHLLVGNPTKSIFPKPELFDIKILSLCLEQAYSRVSRNSFRKKTLEDKKDQNGRRTIIRNFLGQEPIDEEIEKYTELFSESYPEMCVFAYSKAVYKQIINREKDLIDTFRNEYENIFGYGSFELYSSCSTQLNPAKHFKQVIEPFWDIELENTKIRHLNWKRRRDYLIKILTDIFNSMFRDFKLQSLSEKISENIINDLIYPEFTEISNFEFQNYLTSKSRIFLGPKKSKKQTIGFICPICNQPTISGIRSNDNIITKSNSFTNRAKFGQSTSKSIWICDNCKYEQYLLQILTGYNGIFNRTIYLLPQYNLSNQIGIKFLEAIDNLRQKTENLMSDISTNPEQIPDFSETKKIAQNVINNINKIETKKIEDFIITDISKDKKDEVEKHIIEELLKYNEELPLKKDEAKAISIINKEFEKNYKNFKDFVSEMKQDDQFREKLMITKKNPKLSEIDEALINHFGENFPMNINYNKALNMINNDFITDYKEWDNFIKDFKQNRIKSEIAHDIVKNVYNLIPKYQIIAQTPNFVIIPLIKPIKNKVKSGSKWVDESDVNGTIRELFISIIFSSKLGCSVAIADNISKIDIEQRRGSVYVPGNHLLRQLTSDSWLRSYNFVNEKGINVYSDEKWLIAIASALSLSYMANYSNRTNLFEILKSKTKGHLLRRIEMQEEKDNKKSKGRVSYLTNPNVYKFIENIWEVRK